MNTPGESTPSSGPPLSCPFSAEKGRCDLLSPIGHRLRTTRELCRTFLDSVVTEFRCRLGQAWGLDPVRNKLNLLATSGSDEPETKYRVLDCARHLTGKSVERKRTTRHPDVRAPDTEGRTFSHRGLIDQLGLKEMISIPVLNSCNPNQVLVIINLFPGEDSALPNQEILDIRAIGLARQIETHLNERCIRSARRLQVELRRVNKRKKENVCKPLAKLVRAGTGSDLVSVFLETADRLDIRTYASDGSSWTDEPKKPPPEGLERRTWQENREHLSLDLLAEGSGLCLEKGAQNADKTYTGLFVPLRDLSGKAKGMVRCVNGCSNHDALRPFTYDDVALIEAMGQVFVLQLENLLAEQAHIDALNKLAHEMRVPIVAFKAVVETVQDECEAANVRFRWDHFEELHIYTDVMGRLLTQLDLVRLGAYRVPLNPRRTNFQKAIIAPAKRHIRPLLVKASLSADQIRYDGLGDFPMLWIDPGLMSHVVFNLMENAIKYCGDDLRTFRLEINARVLPDHFELVFRDFGIGVPQGFEQRIFDQGERGPGAHWRDVAGEGLGLWIANEIVRRHDGELVLASARDPTEFVIRLPAYLEHDSPRDNVDDEERS